MFTFLMIGCEHLDTAEAVSSHENKVKFCRITKILTEILLRMTLKKAK